MADNKYGRIIVEGKDIPEGEPLFLLRGQDRLAPVAVEMYAWLLWARGDREGAKACMDQVVRMWDWPVKKWPD